ncbi:MAG TPA: hypothetical protein VFT26_07690, partial [Pyrinomonadaceae bacterium]|nr:hypothetical protein [Pyrinomonadaceae bacterium]
MNRLYVVETTPSNTGAIADHTWVVKPSEFEAIARAIGAAATAQSTPAQSSLPWIDPLVRDLQQHRGASIVVAGENQPPFIHALGHAMNNALGNVGKTVFYTDPLEVNPVDQRQSLQELINDLEAGLVDLLVIIGGNPVHDTPVDLKLSPERLNKVKKLRVHLSPYKDETSEWCHWHVPAAHYLESWGDTRSYDGTVTIMQPLIEPLYEGKTAHELLAVFSTKYDRKPYEIVRTFWQSQRASGNNQGQAQTARAQTQPAGNQNNQQAPAPAPSPSPSQDFETWWRKSIHDGYVENSAFPTKTVSLNSGWANQQTQQAQQPAAGTFELVFRTDPSIYDG